jgi:hypothetical protein
VVLEKLSNHGPVSTGTGTGPASIALCSRRASRPSWTVAMESKPPAEVSQVERLPDERPSKFLRSEPEVGIRNHQKSVQVCRRLVVARHDVGDTAPGVKKG